MSPSFDERLASVIRALTDVVLPSLPPEASLAQEQVQLAIGHLSILRAQLDAGPGFEAEELADVAAFARSCGVDTAAADTASDPVAVREARRRIHEATTRHIKANAGDPALRAAVLAHERMRSAKDRRWFAPFGFDSGPAAE